jgi:hypothetical protein
VIELLEGLPKDIVAFEGIGEVPSADYEHVVVPTIEHALETNARVRLLHILGERLDRHTTGALWANAKLGGR